MPFETPRLSPPERGHDYTILDLDQSVVDQYVDETLRDANMIRTAWF